MEDEFQKFMDDERQKFEDAFSALKVSNPALMIMGPDGHVVVAIHTDPPKVEVNPAYEADEAAKLFWECVRQHMPLPPPPAQDGEGEPGW